MVPAGGKAGHVVAQSILDALSAEGSPEMSHKKISEEDQAAIQNLTPVQRQYFAIIEPDRSKLALRVEWERQAAELGSPTAQRNLGSRYEFGRLGVTQDLGVAAKWYRLAAEQGDVLAQYRLGGMYANGKGVNQDFAEAADWNGKAAAQGMKEAQEHQPWLLASAQRKIPASPRQFEIEKQPNQNVTTVRQSSERTSFTNRPALRVTAFFVCVIVAICFAQQRKARVKLEKQLESQRMRILIDQGYRTQPDGSTRLATQEELWQEGSLYDYKYFGKDKNGKLMEIYGMKGQQKIFGKFQGYDSELTYGDISIEGEWIDKGKIKARDKEGNEFEIEITGKE